MLGTVFWLGSCAQIVPFSSKELTKPTGPGINLNRLGFDQLPGWSVGHYSHALTAFKKSCKKLIRIPGSSPVIDPSRGRISLLAGLGYDWWDVCHKAQRVGADSLPTTAKRFFESWFVPYQIFDNGATEGLITGYFEPMLRGSRRKTLRFKVPLYKKPDDLVSVDLGSFNKKWKGQRLFGRVADDKLIPYEARAEIERGSLKGKNLELIWVDDPVDAFFLHIQGSGRIILPSGKSVRVGYAGKNGQPYFAIGRELVTRGVLSKEMVSLQSIRRWLIENPEEAQALMNKNKSYVFFRTVSGSGPIGAQGVPLTPGYSLAVDRRFVPLGAPLWLDTTNPLKSGEPLRRLVIAQDTGGAIKGGIRGDLFWGAGVRARQGAGRMKEKGRLYVLLPRSAASGREPKITPPLP